MEKPANNFDFVARWYDQLARLVFGKSMVQAQMYFVNRIPDGSRVLILGGGTGWLLEKMLAEKPGCEVWYIDASQKMVEMARQKIPPHVKVHFIHGTESDIPFNITYHVVMTHFYLDLFSPEALLKVVRKIKPLLDKEGQWIVTDFESGSKWWQKMLLKMMYFFFRITAGVQVNQLPPWTAILESSGMKSEAVKFYFNGFIRSASYKLLQQNS